MVADAKGFLSGEKIVPDIWFFVCAFNPITKNNPVNNAIVRFMLQVVFLYLYFDAASYPYVTAVENYFDEWTRLVHMWTRNTKREQGTQSNEEFALNNKILRSAFPVHHSIFSILYPPTPTRLVSSGPPFLFLC
jgi:hypothetical protein